jgi:hypothetical protein
MNEAKSPVKLDAETLAAFLNHERLPRLLYLNACDSQGIADAISATVDIAIGSTAPITNRAARAAAVAFYEDIFVGGSVGRAFKIAQKMLEAMQDKQASLSIFYRDGIDLDAEVLQGVPRLVARLVNKNRGKNRNVFDFQFGLAGCPISTKQVVFFTDDRSFTSDESDNPAGDICTVSFNPLKNGIVWVDDDDSWEVVDNIQIYATGVTGDGRAFTAGAKLADAIETYLKINQDQSLQLKTLPVISKLRNS